MECGIRDHHDVLERNFGSITSLLSTAHSVWCGREQQGYAAEISYEHIMVVTNTTLHRPSRGCPEKGQLRTATHNMYGTYMWCIRV
jgi:hypothetical protein